MMISEKFESILDARLRRVFQGFLQPVDIQRYLDNLPYVAEERDRSPLAVMKDHQAHCLDGGIFAALALSRLGHPPMIMDLVPEPGKDDDHVLALYRIEDRWGCIAKSNYSFLRFREAVYKNLRELAMTYFEPFTSTLREKTLRGYTRPLTLEQLSSDWLWDDAGIHRISNCLYHRKVIPLIPDGEGLSLSDDRYYTSNSMGTNFEWAYGVRKNP